MDSPDKSFADIVGLFKSFVPWRTEPPTVSRDFWMPDQSCRVCYECDSQFTLINRRHHCRICGRVFCAKCTSNSIPLPSSRDSRTTITREEWEKIRVCNYCFKQWQQNPTLDYGSQVPSLAPSSSFSVVSLSRSDSSGTANSSSYTPGSMPHSIGPFQQGQVSMEAESCQTSQTETSFDDKQVEEPIIGKSDDHVTEEGYEHSNGYFYMNRSDDDDDEYSIYRSDSESQNFPQVNDYYHRGEFDDMINDDGLQKAHLDGETIESKSLSTSPLNNSFLPHGLEGDHRLGERDEHYIDYDGEASSSMYPREDDNAEPVDFENNGLLWLPPEPEDEEDEREAEFFDDDDDDGDVAGEWGRLRPSASFGSGEFSNRDRSSEDHKKAMKNVVDGHFRALIAQLLQVENVPLGDEGDKEGWLEIITSLSWEAATLLKPDTSTGGGMDPGGYVKVKCLASGRRSESMMVKGVVCKKNVAHRRMTSKIEKPRLLILGGALEYQRVSNHLSSFDTLLQQEMDHLKMAVAKIDAHNPDVLLVEKSVSRFAQEYLLAKDISLVLNIKKPLLERIARCTGAQIVPSIDHLSSPKLGYCEIFHVQRFLEELGTAGQSGKKLVKTLMYFEGCPKPLGFTILLRGANGDELKKVKHVVQYGVFAAYHLALETSFLADEGASPELPFNSSITVALPDKLSSIERSISTVPGFSVPVSDKSQGPHHISESQRSISIPTEGVAAIAGDGGSVESGEMKTLTENTVPLSVEPTLPSFSAAAFLPSLQSTIKVVADSYCTFDEKNRLGLEGTPVTEISMVNDGLFSLNDHFAGNMPGPVDGITVGGKSNLGEAIVPPQLSSEVSSGQKDGNNNAEDPGPLKEDFPPSPSDHQSILVSLSSRCVWKGTVCERSHLFRIKYYGSFDKPLGRFLRDHLFDQSYSCRICEMPSEAHVHCYTHRQGTLTISVKKLPEFLLPGERDGKIWMWHRCLKCPRTNGFPPATRRVIMSDAAWGLSFGKFLELSFSNHAAASRVASCGHSLHRDCLRFYGFGKMVACFRYASINVLSVYLPPSKLDFSLGNQEWIQKEAAEVVDRAELLFSEILTALGRIAEKRHAAALHNGSTKPTESRRQITELEALLQKEKAEFQESLQKVVHKEAKRGQPAIDILEINRLRRQLLFQSYMWDHRLIYAANLDDNNCEDVLNGSPSAKAEKSPGSTGMSSVDLSPLRTNISDHRQSGALDSVSNQYSPVDKEKENPDVDSSPDKENSAKLASTVSMCDQYESLESGGVVRRTLSEGQVPILANLSETLDAAWTGENHLGAGILKDNGLESLLSDSSTPVSGAFEFDNHVGNNNGTKGPDDAEESVSWLRMPFLNFYRSLNKNFLASSEKLDTLNDYNPVYVSSFRQLELKGGARLLLPVGINDTVIPVYDDEPTSIISYALVSPEYHGQVTDELERMNYSADFGSSSFSFPDSMASQSFHFADDMSFDSHKSLGGSTEDTTTLTMSASRSSLILDPLSYTKTLHARVSFGDDGPIGKVKYSVTCYYAQQFAALRRMCCPNELDFVRSLSRCKKWGAQGGKSNVFFAKTLDDRFIIKQVTKTELESFIKFAPEYFKYLSESISSRSPTCLAKILGIYQVASKHLKSGKESKMDVLVMENLLFRRNVTRLYDLKGSSRSRYNPDSTGNNKVLLDQNLIEAMPTSPIFVGNKAKRLLERAVWNDTSFLASIDVMDYSLLVGLDEEKHELVLGIIDFMRQYTWDKHLETWVKASGILGGPKNSTPTVISPMQYKKRFRKAMTTYFLMVPDQWSPPSILPTKSLSDVGEDNTQGAASVE
ncbi:unnamed protein product [Linum tenue]|uniref:1-phosphatidylinositol-3-phosphate 5-kinase n=1 Tax=Linum tenue TaxID=586396 RepID=A0AAV0PPB9_9ROSI|nr:unnamed protein product [Linum tenue]